MNLNELKSIYKNCLFCGGQLQYENNLNIYSGSFACVNTECVNFKVLLIPDLPTVSEYNNIIDYNFWGYSIVAHGFHIYFWPNGNTVFQSSADNDGVRGEVQKLKCNEFTINDAVKSFKLNNLKKFKNLAILK